MGAHQAAQFYIDPKLSHERRIIQRLGKYLIDALEKVDKGIIFKPDPAKGVEFFLMLILYKD